MNKQLMIIPGAALLVLVGGYLGLSSYASNKAEKRLEDWLYDHKLEDAVRWKSLSASPLGGSLTLKEVSLSGNALLDGLEVDIDKLRISDFVDERDLQSVQLELKGVRQAGAKPGPFSVLHNLAQSSGRAELKPFDVSLGWRYDQGERQVKVNYQLEVPELFASQADTQLNNARNLDRLGEELVGSALLSAFSNPLGLLGLQRQFDTLGSIELGDTRFELKDLGYFKRTAALNERYDGALVPGKGPVKEQREALNERDQRRAVKECTSKLRAGLENAEAACTAQWLLAHGQSQGVSLRAEPERVRLSDLWQISEGGHERGLRALKKLNLEVEQL